MIVGEPWERVGIDITSPHPTSSKGNVGTKRHPCRRIVPLMSLRLTPPDNARPIPILGPIRDPEDLADANADTGRPRRLILRPSRFRED